MSNKIKNVFTIKDLENLSGIKAHTIRMWEKRYSILEPMRTDSNIRYYDIHNLQKLLNVSTLNSFGYKISNIAKLPEERIPILVKEVLSNKSMTNFVLNNFKLAMMNFDLPLFSNTYAILQADNTFRTIFYEYFLPLLDDIGMLWQTGTISPAHEHFVSSLIKQKVAANTDKLQHIPPTKTDRVYALYLPENEIHEIGLMFINYELLLNGYQTIYVGESMPITYIRDIKNYFDNVTFITYITSQPYAEDITPYIRMVREQILKDETSELLIFGRNTQYINQKLLTDGKVKAFTRISDLDNLLELT